MDQTVYDTNIKHILFPSRVSHSWIKFHISDNVHTSHFHSGNNSKTHSNQITIFSISHSPPTEKGFDNCTLYWYIPKDVVQIKLRVSHLVIGRVDKTTFTLFTRGSSKLTVLALSLFLLPPPSHLSLPKRWWLTVARIPSAISNCHMWIPCLLISFTLWTTRKILVSWPVSISK